MKEENKKILENIALTYTKLANFNNKELIYDRLEKLYKLDEDDVIDKVLSVIYDFVSNERISKDDALYHLDMLCELNNYKYKTREDLVNRLGFLKSMNLLGTTVPLSENHKAVLEAFDKFNELIGTSFDCFYTGGMMGYLATNHELVRYHSDLDIVINEDELEKLKKLVDSSKDFEFVSHVDKKSNIGHEYFIVYKGNPVDIGLFLFERKNDGSVVRKSYYYDRAKELKVDEEYLDKEYVDLTYTGDIYSHNGIEYKMMSLESIYEAKRGSRPKDQYDANVIKDYVDMGIVEKIADARKKNAFTPNISAKGSVVERFEKNNKRGKK